MRRHVEGDGPEIDLLVGVDTRHDEEETRTLGAPRSQSTQSEHHGPLVLLDDLEKDTMRGRFSVKSLGSILSKVTFWTFA